MLVARAALVELPSHIPPRNFVLACANLRMKFFEIKPMDKIDAIRFVGNSLAATSTSTAVAAGLASLLFLKLFRQRNLLSQADTLEPEQQEILRKLFYSFTHIDLQNHKINSIQEGSVPESFFCYRNAHWKTWDVWKLKSNARVADLWLDLESRRVDLRMLKEVSLVELLRRWSCG